MSISAPIFLPRLPPPCKVRAASLFNPVRPLLLRLRTSVVVFALFLCEAAAVADHNTAAHPEIQHQVNGFMQDADANDYYYK